MIPLYNFLVHSNLYGATAINKGWRPVYRPPQGCHPTPGLPGIRHKLMNGISVLVLGFPLKRFQFPRQQLGIQQIDFHQPLQMGETFWIMGFPTATDMVAVDMYNDGFQFQLYEFRQPPFHPQPVAFRRPPTGGAACQKSAEGHIQHLAFLHRVTLADMDDRGEAKAAETASFVALLNRHGFISH